MNPCCGGCKAVSWLSLISSSISRKRTSASSLRSAACEAAGRAAGCGLTSLSSYTSSTKPGDGALTGPRVGGRRTELHMAGTCRQRMGERARKAQSTAYVSPYLRVLLARVRLSRERVPLLAAARLSTLQHRRELRARALTAALGPELGKLGPLGLASSWKMLNSPLRRPGVNRKIASCSAL